MVDTERREYRLRDALEPLRERFRFIVLDCPPALDLLTLNALVAADGVLIPMQAEYFALEGVSELLDTIERIRVGLNPGLVVEGVVLTMFDERTNLAQQVADGAEEVFGEKLCRTTIPRNIRLAEAPSHGKRRWYMTRGRAGRRATSGWRRRCWTGKRRMRRLRSAVAGVGAAAGNPAAGASDSGEAA